MRRIAQVGGCIVLSSLVMRTSLAECRTAFSCKGAMSELVCLRAEALCDEKIDCQFDGADEDDGMCIGTYSLLAFIDICFPLQLSSATARRRTNAPTLKFVCHARSCAMEKRTARRVMTRCSVPTRIVSCFAALILSLPESIT